MPYLSGKENYMIYHIEEIDKIRDVETATSRRTGKPVFDISNWNSGKDYHNYLYQYLKLPVINDYFDYIYGYEISNDIHCMIREKFNFKYSDKASVLFPSSTLSIVNLVNFLQKKNAKNICILQPSYFSVEPCLQAFGLNPHNEELEYIDNKFYIPMDKLLQRKYDAVWITSPIFCTNIIINESEISKLNYLLENKIYLICDESLSTDKNRVCPSLIQNEYLFGIYSPHKVLGTNALKFSCIIMNQEHQDFFNMWSDLFSGGMPLSSQVAIKHFLTTNYDIVLQKGLTYIHQTYIKLKELLYDHKDYCSFTPKSGLYVTIIIRKIPYELSTHHHFIKSLIENTCVSLLPGYLEGFYEKFGFCFRVNLTLNQAPLLLSVNKVLSYLKKEFL